MDDLGEGIGLGPSGLESGEERGAGVEVEALDVEGVGGASGAVVALEHHHVEAVPRQEARAAEPAEPAPDHHHVRLRPLRHPERTDDDHRALIRF